MHHFHSDTFVIYSFLSKYYLAYSNFFGSILYMGSVSANLFSSEFHTNIKFLSSLYSPSLYYSYSYYFSY